MGKDNEINMPVVSINIRDTEAVNDTSEESASFVTTLSNVNNEPPKEDVVYCMNLTGLDTINFAYKVTSKESAYRFDLKYPTVDIFFAAILRWYFNGLFIYSIKQNVYCTPRQRSWGVYWFHFYPPVCPSVRPSVDQIVFHMRIMT